MKIAGRKLTALTLVAILLVLVAGILAILDWRQASKQYAFVDYIRSNALPLVAGGDTSNLDGKLVYSVGTPAASNPLKDPDLGFQLDALSLQRSSMIYQWVEYRGKHTRYDKEWVPHAIDSSNFGQQDRHENVGKPDFKSYSDETSSIDFNGVKLDRAYLQLMVPRRVPMKPEMLVNAPKWIKAQYEINNGNLIKRFIKTGDPKARSVIGDNLIKFTGIRPSLILVIGQYDRGMIRPMETPFGTIAIIEPGRRSLETIYQDLTPGISFWTVALGTLAILFAFVGILALKHDFTTAPRIVEILRFGRQTKH